MRYGDIMRILYDKYEVVFDLHGTAKKNVDPTQQKNPRHRLIPDLPHKREKAKQNTEDKNKWSAQVYEIHYNLNKQAEPRP